MGKSIIAEKSYAFAVRIVRMYQHLSADKKEFILSKQVLRSGTSIGANVQEATGGQSTSDFIHKLSIARKEARETAYWLQLLHDTGYLEAKQFESTHADCQGLIKILNSIILTSQGKSKTNSEPGIRNS
ncbi:four helix bundle protein [Pontibacter sp. E15-1]|uniref:four helix bundle protein n=1 Tax=Pontibacter sp. E15-1 TaxID=2919918 RepID=UPI001F4FFB2D|nr:four helix bundle protein [Pontibacter sp. E15-1]MCJ8165198.1 four helix bundle protein [Pontibacter sp. E15-1]